MTYTKGSNILAADFNNFSGPNNAVTPYTSPAQAAQKIAALYGVGFGSRGYGQTTYNLDNVITGNDISSTDWANLRNAVNVICQHQGTAVTLLPPVATSGAAVVAHEQDPPSNNAYDYQNIILSADTNRYNTDGGASMTLTSNILTIVRSTTWGASGPEESITAEGEFNFTSENQARYFFNSGGELRLTLSHSNVVTADDTAWNAIFGNIGTIKFGVQGTTRTGTSGTPQAIGYYQLTTLDQLIFDGNNIGGGAYAANDVYVYARATSIGGSNGGNGYVIRITVVLRDQSTFNAISGGVTATFGMLKATAYLSSIVTPSTTTVQEFVNTGDSSPEIFNSLRFSAPSSQSLSFTPSAVGNRKTWTWSGWVKRSAFDTDTLLFSAGTADVNRTVFYYDTASSTLYLLNNTGAGYLGANTVAVFRDITAWYHIVLSVDTTQAVASDRHKIYINGVLQTLTLSGGGIPQNVDTYINSTTAHYLGRNSSTATGYFNGYLSRVCLINGQALTASSFGYVNSNNQWSTLAASVIKDLANSSDNSFMLDFDNGTSTTTLGYDYSGSYNSALLHFDGTDASTTFTDQSGKTWTAGGTAKLATAQKKFGTASGVFDGTSNCRITTPTHSDFDFGTGDFTIDFWMRPPTITATGGLINRRLNGGSFGPFLIWQSNANILVYMSSTGASWDIASGATVGGLVANTWNHIALVRNGTNFKVYVNGVGTTIATSAATLWANSQQITIGADGDGLNSFTGHIDEVRFVKGRAMWTSNFIPPTTAYVNKKHNNWTLSNMTRATGVDDCWMTDTPSNNYCTLNPLALGQGTLSFGNLRLTNATAAWMSRLGTIRLTSGKHYFEGQGPVTSTGTYVMMGVRSSNANMAAGEYPGSTSGGYGILINSTTAQAYTNATAGASQAGSYNSTSTLRCAIDIDAGKIWLGVNSIWLGGGNPVTGTSPTYTFTAGTEFYPMFGVYNTSNANINFGQRAFVVGAPTGFNAVNIANMSTPSIIVSKQHFDVVTRAGTNTRPFSVTGLQFNPDLIWPKARSIAYQGFIIDKVRGGDKILISSSTAVESTVSGTISSFNNDGYTCNGGGGSVSETGQTYVDWLWKAGGAAVVNNAGTVQSNVSANTTAGVSIITVTGAGSAGTVGHGLGASPAMLIFKSRNNVGTTGWNVWHKNLASSIHYLDLSSAAAQSSGGSNFSGTWNSTVFGLTATPLTNGANLIAYAFSEIPGYSRFSSYTGNGSTDGPFVWCGFRPKYLLVKRIDVANDWGIYDVERDTIQPMDYYLVANTASAETAAGPQPIDFLANGFKLRGIGAFINASGGTHIFAAFAEAPFKYANAR